MKTTRSMPIHPTRPPTLTSTGLARRSFIKTLAAGTAGVLPLTPALADHGDQERENRGMNAITNGDAAILRFLAAAEILETDLWQQYTDFVNQDGPYTSALEAIDGDMPPYIDQNTADE